MPIEDKYVVIVMVVIIFHSVFSSLLLLIRSPRSPTCCQLISYKDVLNLVYPSNSTQYGHHLVRPSFLEWPIIRPRVWAIERKCWITRKCNSPGFFFKLCAGFSASRFSFSWRHLLYCCMAGNSVFAEGPVLCRKHITKSVENKVTSMISLLSRFNEPLTLLIAAAWGQKVCSDFSTIDMETTQIAQIDMFDVLEIF